jgi:hypothetical protein
MIKIPDGYRQLNKSERVKEGDRFLLSGEWVISSNFETGIQAIAPYIRKTTNNTNMIKIPDGYRQLNTDELVIKGDKILSGSEWAASVNWQHPLQRQQHNSIYIRKITNNTTNMKLQIENKPFTLNINRAVELGVLTPDRVPITDIKAGDKFKHPSTGKISTIISVSGYNSWLPKTNIMDEDFYICAGINGNQSAAYIQPLRNKVEMLRWLYDNSYIRI